MKRRTFIRTSTGGLLACALVPARAAETVAPADAFDPEVEAFMKARGVPGGALAVVKDRKLVYAKGYGLADREQKTPATPESLFRIASISKPVTAVAVLQLIETGKLKLETKAYEFLGIDLSQAADPRLGEITIEQLLHHTGGWNRDKSFDPMFRARAIAMKLGEPPPAGPAAVIRYMLDHKLDAAPGSAYSYSNFGYLLLGRVIEKVTGMGYESYMREKVLAPIGIHQMRIGASLRTGRAEGEVCYYGTGDEAAQADNVFDTPPGKVPWPYGGFYLEAMDAHGGWLASAVDLARFAAALDDPAHSPMLQRGMFDTMYAPPAAPVSREADGSLKERFYACGWSVRPVGKDGRANYFHDGSLPGTATFLIRRHDGLSWAMLFNQRSEDKSLPDRAIDTALHKAADRVTVWPEGTALLPA